MSLVLNDGYLFSTLILEPFLVIVATTIVVVGILYKPNKMWM